MKKGFFLGLTVALAVAAAGTGAAVTRGEAAPSAAKSPAAAGTALVRCGKTRTIGLAAPITGPAASLGAQQRSWVKFFVDRYNRSHRRTKFRLREGDTELPNTAAAVRAAQLISTSNALGVVGPAGSQEVVATTPVFRANGLGFISGSATRTSLTQESIRRGYFFRVVPPDSAQGATVANYMIRTLKVRRVHIIDDQEAYSTGLADEVQRRLRAARVTVDRSSVSQEESNFSSVITRINRNTNVVYIPWQLAPKAQAFGQQMRAQGRRATLFGSDGLFDPTNFKISGSYLSFFPVSATHSIFKAYRKTHGGRPNYFGAPSFVAAQVVAGAIDRACKNGTATRAEVRAQIRRTRLRSSLLGLPVRFRTTGDIRGGQFGIYRIVNGIYTPVG